MIRYGVVGTGWIVDAFIDAAKKVDELQLCAVYSRTIERASQFAKKYVDEGNSSIYFFDNLEEMASSDKIDACYIASPNLLHFEQSKLMLKHKKHVICEKPITVSRAEAEELFLIAKENNVIFMEAIMAMHSPQLLVLEDAIKQIGKISLARLDYSQLSSKYEALKAGENPNIFNIDMKTGCVMDIGIYCIYIALHLFKGYQSLASTAVKLPSSLDLCGTTTMDYGDKIVLLSYSKIANGIIQSEIQGNNGTIIIDMVSRLNKITIRHNDKTTEVLFEADENQTPMQFEAQSFADYINNFEQHKSKYDYLSDLSVQVAETLQKIRKASGVNF